MQISACFDVGKDYHPADNIDGVHPILTPSACQAECQKLPACQYWTLITNGNICYRKGSKPTTPQDKSDATSGPKYCQLGKTFDIQLHNYYIIMNVLYGQKWKLLVKPFSQFRGQTELQILDHKGHTPKASPTKASFLF